MPICTLQSPEEQYSTNPNRKISFIGTNTTCLNFFVQPELEHHKRKKKEQRYLFYFHLHDKIYFSLFSLPLHQVSRKSAISKTYAIFHSIGQFAALSLLILFWCSSFFFVGPAVSFKNLVKDVIFVSLFIN